MTAARPTRLDRLQGLAARALSRLPPRVQLRLAGGPPVSIDGQTLDSQSQLVLAIQRRRGRASLTSTPEEARAQFRRDMLAVEGARAAVGSVRDFQIPGPAGDIRVRHYAPAVRSADLLVYFHGGGFVVGDLDTHDAPCRLVCLHAATHVLGVDYRLAPENPFPAGLEDARAALAWAQGHARELTGGGARVSVGGDSAGANLATVSAALAAREGRAPFAQLLVYPPTDSLTPRPSWELFARGFFLTSDDRDTFTRRYLDGTGVGGEDPRVSPLFLPDLARLPPALVVTAGFDLLRDEGEAYAAALGEAGVRVRARRFAELSHGFFNMTPISRAAHRAVVETARDWRALLDEVIYKD